MLAIQTDVCGFPFFGDLFKAEKIGEILRTGSLTRNEEFYANPINRRRVLFESVWGFGPQAVDQILKVILEN